jgi:hypothetical protein
LPRIPNGILESVAYLYPSVDDARRGTATGGTGFLVSVKCEQFEGLPPTVYVVTNSHVVQEGQSSVVRLNTQDGGTEVLPITQDSCVHHPEGDDIAICQVDLIDAVHRYRAIDHGRLITSDEVDEWSIGPGEDVFFIGRFIRHDGNQRNLPTARFGNISMLPLEPLRHPRGYYVDGFRVEARSLSGYSGSPVWVVIEPMGIRTFPMPDLQDDKPKSTGLGLFLGLLGIDWGHEPDYRRVLDENRQPHGEEMYVEQNSGIMHVVPSWKLIDLLGEREVVELRQARERRTHEKLRELAVPEFPPIKD